MRNAIYFASETTLGKIERKTGDETGENRRENSRRNKGKTERKSADETRKNRRENRKRNKEKETMKQKKTKKSWKNYTTKKKRIIGASIYMFISSLLKKSTKKTNR